MYCAHFTFKFRSFLLSFFAIISIMALTACDALISYVTERKIQSEELLGKWTMQGDCQEHKQIILAAGGVARFVNLFGKDIGMSVETTNALPKDAKWTIRTDCGETTILFDFHFGWADYRHGGSLDRVDGDLAIRFPVGDPDDFVFKDFIRPKVRSQPSFPLAAPQTLQ